MEEVGSGLQSFHGIHSQIELVELRSRGIEEIGADAARGPVEHGGELRQGDRGAGKPAAGASPQDDLFDRVARHGLIR